MNRREAAAGAVPPAVASRLDYDWHSFPGTCVPGYLLSLLRMGLIPLFVVSVLDGRPGRALTVFAVEQRRGQGYLADNAANALHADRVADHERPRQDQRQTGGQNKDTGHSEHQQTCSC